MVLLIWKPSKKPVELIYLLGLVERTLVKEGADWFVDDYKELIQAHPRQKVAIMVASGAFASAVLQMISHNATTKSAFQDRVDMYVCSRRTLQLRIDFETIRSNQHSS